MAQHWTQMEDALTAAINALASAQPDDPVAFIGQQLQQPAPAPAPAGEYSSSFMLHAAFKEAVAAPAPAESVEGDSNWSVRAWLESLSLEQPVLAALAPPNSTKDYAFMRQLTEAEMQRRMRAAGLEGLAPTIWAATCRLREQEAETGERLNAKFASDGGTIELAFGELDKFYSGLEGLLGPPTLFQGSLLRQIEREHCDCRDSDVPFGTSNNMNNVTSMIEHEFVVAPKGGIAYEERSDFRCETQRSKRRSKLTLDELEKRMGERNAELKAAAHVEMSLIEAVAGRLYTGPMCPSRESNSQLPGTARPAC